MKVRLVNFHCIIDIDVLVENHTAYMTCTNMLEIKQGPLIFLSEINQ
jgi:hypothetical protein